MPSENIEAINVASDTNRKFKMNNPHTCPICKNKKFPKLIKAVFSKEFEKDTNDYKNEVVSIHFCSNCGHLFIVIGTIDRTYKTIKTYPLSPQKQSFPIEIQNLSPTFVDLFCQSIKAEEQGLESIAGMGYRKSLEFLIKDYLINKFPSDKDKIETELLSNSINRIKDERIKILATKATWLGNDYVHYVNKHPEYDINDLKEFINAAAVYIEAELCLDRAINMKYV